MGDANTIAVLDSPGDANVVRAVGPGSVGIRLGGNGNRVINSGIVAGSAAAVQGGGGSDVVINRFTFEGDVLLGEGGDRYQIEPGGAVETITVTGVVNGGAGLDTFVVRARDDTAAPGGPVVLAVDGDQYVGFERLRKDGAGLMALSGTLNLGDGDSGTASIEDGGLRLDGGTLAAGRIDIDGVAPDGLATVSGNGTLSGAVTGPGTIADTVVVLGDRGVFGPGDSAGRIDIIGDLESSGVFQIEIGGLDEPLFDVIDVSGDVTLLGGAFEISFIDDFLPSLGDTFDFLRVGGTLSGLELVSTAVGGLPGGFELALDGLASGLRLVTTREGAPAPSVAEPPATALWLTSLLVLGARRKARSARRVV